MTIGHGEIVYVIVFVLIIGTKLLWDYHAKNTEHRIINHTFSAVLDTILFSSVALFLFSYLAHANIWISVGSVGLALSFRWVLFDILFNLENKNKWDHTGQSSKMDRALAKYGQWLKLIPMAISIAILEFLG